MSEEGWPFGGRRLCRVNFLSTKGRLEVGDVGGFMEERAAEVGWNDAAVEGP